MKYLKTFNNDSEYVVDQPNFSHPHVSYVKSPRQVIYEKTAPAHDYSKDYLTFEAISAGTFAFTNACSYSLDDGTTWTALAANTSTPTVSAGNKIMFKADSIWEYGEGCGTFSSTGQFNVMGNPISMLSGDTFTTASNMPYVCYQMFKGCTGLISAENVYLGQVLVHYCEEMFSGCTSLVTPPALPDDFVSGSISYCYQNMFAGCTSLTTAPELPAENISLGCYNYMFYGCTNLNYVKCLAKNFAHAPTEDWLNGVSATGTFVKNPDADWSEMTSGFGIPNGWTVVDAT